MAKVLFISRQTLTRWVAVACVALIAFAYARLALPEQADQAASASAGAKLHPVYSVDRGKEKILAISFDAAWGAEKTEGIMDILDRYGIRSTFFLVGFWVDKYPEKVEQIDARGHEIGNHSTHHPRMTELTLDKMKEELDVTADKIEALVNKRPTLFRCPFGDYDNRVLQAAGELGYQTIQWDVDSLDWKEQGVDAMVRQVTGKIKPGSIVLFHNNSRDILEALPIILDRVIAEGYAVVPVSELLLSGDTKVDQLGIQRAAGR